MSTLRTLPLLATLGLAMPGIAGEFGVTPIRLDFDRATRGASVTVINDSSTEAQSFNVKLYKWTQNAEGIDDYQESNDLIYFPRQVTIPPKSEQVVRVGLKGALPAVEVAYRLFVEELAVAPKAESTTTPTVNYRLRFGVPIFLVPLAPALSGKLEMAAMNKTTLALSVANTGNQHFRIESLRLRSGDKTLAENPGFYVLAGARRAVTINLPASVCERAKSGETMELIGRSEKLEFAEKIQGPIDCK